MQFTKTEKIVDKLICFYHQHTCAAQIGRKIPMYDITSIVEETATSKQHHRCTFITERMSQE